MLKRLLENLPRWWGGGFKRGGDVDYLETARKLARSDDVAGAWAACQVARSRDGETAELLALEGGLFGIKGDFVEARRLLEAALKFDPSHVKANADLANIALAQGRLDEAAGLVDHALKQSPSDPALLTNRGQIERARENWLEAERYLASALAIEAGYTAAVDALFSVYDESEQYHKALELVDDLLAANITDGHWMHMRGFLLYKRLLDPLAADELFDRAERAGEAGLAFWVDRGICARDLGDGARALQYLDRALELEKANPLPLFHKGLVYLYQQRYAEGWDAYEARLHDHHWLGAPLPAPRWHGENLLGSKLLIMAEQGLGDEIMFASCLRDLPKDADIYIDCDEKLLPILRESFPEIHCVPKGTLPNVVAENEDARAIPIGSLPLLYRNSIDRFPRHAYLSASDDAIKLAEQRLADLGGLKVGISWRGGTEITRRRLRSLPLAQVGKLASVAGVAWVNLQYGDCAEELSALSREYGMHIHHWPELMEPYERTAALVRQLDLVVSVDTTMVHLAGALGRAVWALVPRVPEWRYGFTARDMPWYAQVEILRQSVAGNWDEPLTEVMERLSNMT